MHQRASGSAGIAASAPGDCVLGGLRQAWRDQDLANAPPVPAGYEALGFVALALILLIWSPTDFENFIS